MFTYMLTNSIIDIGTQDFCWVLTSIPFLWIEGRFEL